MKTSKIFLTILAGFLTIVSSCGPNSFNKKSEEQSRQDSIRMADSIAKVQALIEEARLDSIRQDSIRQEQEKILNAMPTVQLFGKNLHDVNGGDLTDVNVLRKKLVALGYEKINANKYVLNPGGEPSVTVVLNYDSWEGEYIPELEEYEGGGMSYAIDLIFSDENDAAAFYKKWKAARKSVWISETKSGKKVTLSTYGD